MTEVSKFAAKTTVSAAKTQVDIQLLLKMHKATDVATGEKGESAVVTFKVNQRRFRMNFAYPEVQTFARTGGRAVRTPAQQKAARDQEIRRLWRALFLIIKGKLEALESGIVTLEEEFLPYIVTEDGQTLYERIKPRLDSNQLFLPPGQ